MESCFGMLFATFDYDGRLVINCYDAVSHTFHSFAFNLCPIFSVQGLMSGVSQALKPNGYLVMCM
jgi:hypothetical protein